HHMQQLHFRQQHKSEWQWRNRLAGDVHFQRGRKLEPQRFHRHQSQHPELHDRYGNARWDDKCRYDYRHCGVRYGHGNIASDGRPLAAITPKRLTSWRDRPQRQYGNKVISFYLFAISPQLPYFSPSSAVYSKVASSSFFNASTGATG